MGRRFGRSLSCRCCFRCLIKDGREDQRLLISLLLLVVGNKRWWWRLLRHHKGGLWVVIMVMIGVGLCGGGVEVLVRG